MASSVQHGVASNPVTQLFGLVVREREGCPPRQTPLMPTRRLPGRMQSTRLRLSVCSQGCWRQLKLRAKPCHVCYCGRGKARAPAEARSAPMCMALRTGSALAGAKACYDGSCWPACSSVACTREHSSRLKARRQHRSVILNTWCLHRLLRKAVECRWIGRSDVWWKRAQLLADV